MADDTEYDVVVLGGGLAGLTVAIQLKRRRPATRIVVIERSAFPVPEIAHKVGESTIEVSCHYFAEIIGMRDHLETQQLRKNGLRFFMTAGDNSDITRRVEIGTSTFPSLYTYQLDRGRFENALAIEVQRLGVELLDASRVRDVALDPVGVHSVTFERAEQPGEVRGRWIIDASGRAAVLKRKLDLAKPVGHHANASWFRLAEPVDVDTWSDDPAWHARILDGPRQLSTVHLMGRGYWVWLIPLAGGSHSIGIVADPDYHPFEQFNTFERSLDWLRAHEPQLADQVEAKRGTLCDFRVMKHFAHGCKEVYSTDRWCLTGEAGAFNDPLFSPGSDNIATSNTYITDIIARELDGEDVTDYVAFYNEGYLTAYESTLSVWEGGYPVFGNAQAFIAKFILGTIVYWGIVSQLFYRNKLTDPEFMVEVLPDIISMGELAGRAQVLLREWDALGQFDWRDGFVAGPADSEMRFFDRLQDELLQEMSDDAVKAKIKENLALLEGATVLVFRKAAEQVADIPRSRAINPYAASLQPERWEEDGLFRDAERFLALEELAADVDRVWLKQPGALATVRDVTERAHAG